MANAIETDRRRSGAKFQNPEELESSAANARPTSRTPANLLAAGSIVGLHEPGKSRASMPSPERRVAENKLFRTLDPTTRRLHLPTNQDVLLTDTVVSFENAARIGGSVQSHVRRSGAGRFTLHVVDLSHPQAEEQILAVNAVLRKSG